MVKNIKNSTNEELLHYYRYIYKHQIGKLSEWKQIEKELLSRFKK